MANAETAVQQKILAALSGLVTLFRNTVGSFKKPDGSWLRYGLMVGSSDLIGWKSVVVTKNMVGQRVAIFVAIEVKTPDGYTDPERLAKQEHFIQTVADAGGLAGFAKSTEDALDIIA